MSLNIVSRYEPCLDFDDESKFASMEDCDIGGYVSYSDYKELESKFEQLQKEHEELQGKLNENQINTKSE